MNDTPNARALAGPPRTVRVPVRRFVPRALLARHVSYLTGYLEHDEPGAVAAGLLAGRTVRATAGLTGETEPYPSAPVRVRVARLRRDLNNAADAPAFADAGRAGRGGAR